MSCTSIANAVFQRILLIRLLLMSFQMIQANYFRDLYSSPIHQLNELDFSQIDGFLNSERHASVLVCALG